MEVVYKPNAFLLGAAKCGTTSLAACLDAHPSIWVAPSKEPTAFCRHFSVIKNMVRYFDEFRTNSAPLVVMDASHGYFSDPESPTVLRLLFPEAKFLVVLRDPVRRAYSLYQHMRRHRYERCSSFEEALLVESRRVEDPLFFKRAPENPWNQLYFRSSCYDEQLQRYLDLFSANQIFIVSLAELARNSTDWLARICEFLGVDAAPKLILPSLNASKYSPIAKHTAASLTKRFEPHMERLRVLVGRDLDITSM